MGVDIKREDGKIVMTQTEPTPLYNPNYDIDRRLDWGDEWVNQIMASDRKKRTGALYFRTLYTALSCVGAKISTWYDIMNFHDCDGYDRPVRKLPVRWKKAGTPPSYCAFGIFFLFISVYEYLGLQRWRNFQILSKSFMDFRTRNHVSKKISW